MSDATVTSLVSRLAVASVEFLIVGFLVALILGTVSGIPPKWRRTIWILAMAKPLVTVVLSSKLGLLPLSKALSGTFLGDIMFPAAAEAPLSGGTATLVIFHALAYVWLIGTAVLLLRVWLRAAGSQQLIDESLEKGYLLKPTALRRLDPGLVVPPNACIIATPEDAGPATLGIFRPAVVVPESLLPWVIQHRDPTLDERARLSQVLRHELAHIANRDTVISLVATIMRSFFWFHPVAHWAYRKVRMNNELCCDENVVASGVEPREYVATLMKIVSGKFARTGFTLSILGDSSPAGVLRRRIHYLLRDPHRGAPMRPARVYAMICLVVLTLPRFIGLASSEVISIRFYADGAVRQIEVEDWPQYAAVAEIVTPGVLTSPVVLPGVERFSVVLADNRTSPRPASDLIAGELGPLPESPLADPTAGVPIDGDAAALLADLNDEEETQEAAKVPQKKKPRRTGWSPTTVSREPATVPILPPPSDRR